MPLGAILTDNGREFCGFVERMNRTLLDECFRVAGRTTWYLEPAEIQRDLDAFLEHYNLRRTHQGYRLGGRPPAQALAGGDRLRPATVAHRRLHRAEGRGGDGSGVMLRGMGAGELPPLYSPRRRACYRCSCPQRP